MHNRKTLSPIAACITTGMYTVMQAKPSYPDKDLIVHEMYRLVKFFHCRIKIRFYKCRVVQSNNPRAYPKVSTTIPIKKVAKRLIPAKPPVLAPPSLYHFPSPPHSPSHPLFHPSSYTALFDPLQPKYSASHHSHPNPTAPSAHSNHPISSPDHHHYYLHRYQTVGTSPESSAYLVGFATAKAEAVMTEAALV